MTGVNGEHVVFVTTRELSGAVSQVLPSELMLNRSRIIAYEMVVARLHSRYTVIPMRYGSLLDGELGVVRLLEQRSKQFMVMLEEVAGCVEMGVRILSPETIKSAADHPHLENRHWHAQTRGRGDQTVCVFPLPSLSASAFKTGGRRDFSGRWEREVCDKLSITGQEDCPALHRQGCGRCSDSPGRHYLAAQRARYVQNDRFAAVRGEFTENVLATFSGLFVKYKLECPSDRIRDHVFGATLFSIYFLVRTELVELFRRRFNEINGEGARLLLTGPWAPYNFVGL